MQKNQDYIMLSNLSLIQDKKEYEVLRNLISELDPSEVPLLDKFMCLQRLKKLLSL